jgi:hypothetical protein
MRKVFYESKNLKVYQDGENEFEIFTISGRNLDGYYEVSMNFSARYTDVYSRDFLGRTTTYPYYNYNGEQGYARKIIFERIREDLKNSIIDYCDIKTATAIYTGGGIYIYYGQLKNGLYFRTCDDFEFISICDADTSAEDADYAEFYDAHEIWCIAEDAFKNTRDSILMWILDNEPEGNYSTTELEQRLIFKEEQ